jgi:hypothetical protein
VSKKKLKENFQKVLTSKKNSAIINTTKKVKERYGMLFKVFATSGERFKKLNFIHLDDAMAWAEDMIAMGIYAYISITKSDGTLYAEYES